MKNKAIIRAFFLPFLIFLGTAISHHSASAQKHIVCDQEQPVCNQEQPAPALSSMRIATYNVGVFGKSGVNTLEEAAAMMKETGAKIISLNELDSCTIRSGKIDQLAAFAKEMGDWTSFYAPTISFMGGYYGIGICASPELGTPTQCWSYKIGASGGHEPRALAVMEFESFVFCTTHLDFHNDGTALRQAMEIDDLLKDRYRNDTRPVFLCGDMNSTPESDVISFFGQSWTILSGDAPTYPSRRPKSCIDYIMVLNNKASLSAESSHSASCRNGALKRFSTGRVSHASDHVPVAVTVLLPLLP